MKKIFKFNIWGILFIALFFISILFLFTYTSFSQASNSQTNLEKLKLAFPVNFTEKEKVFLNALSETDLEKLIRVIKLIIEKNKAAQQSLGNQDLRGKPTTYSNTPSPQTPHYNSSTGQYQSTPASGGGSGGGSSGQGQSQPSSQQPQQPPSQVSSLMQGLAKGLSANQNDSVPVDCNGIDAGSLSHEKFVEEIAKFRADWSSSTGKRKCPNFNTLSCTTFEQIPSKVVLLIGQIRAECQNCEIVLTGGTEIAGHQTHGPRRAIFDMRYTPTISRYIESKGRNINGAKFEIHQPQHWHIIANGYACKK